MHIDFQPMLLGVRVDGPPHQPQRTSAGAAGEQCHEHERVGLQVPVAHHVTEEGEADGALASVHVGTDHGGPGGDVLLGHGVEEGAGGGEVVAACEAGEHGVLGDDVSVGDFFEQGTGVDGGGEGIGVEEGGCDVDMRTEVGLDEVGVEVREEGGEGGVEAGL